MPADLIDDEPDYRDHIAVQNWNRVLDGGGRNAALLASVFERFERAPPSDSDRDVGLALCLQHARELARSRPPLLDREGKAWFGLRTYCTAIGLPLHCPHAVCRRATACMSGDGRVHVPTWCWHHLVRPHPAVHAAYVKVLTDAAANLPPAPDE